MSIDVMRDVWRYSMHKGSALLVLLGLADNADDHGRCFPSIAYQGKKARMSPRNIHNIVNRLVASGELSKESGAGPSGSNVYVIHVHPPEKFAHPPEIQRQQGMQSSVEGYEVASADKPRTTINVEPSTLASTLPNEEHQQAARRYLSITRDYRGRQKDPNIRAWANTIRLMVDRDGFSLEEVFSMLEWALGHTFWFAHVLAPEKLRKHWSSITAQRAGRAIQQADAGAPAVDPLCSVCHEREWTMQQGRSGARTCGPCFDNAQPRRRAAGAAS